MNAINDGDYNAMSLQLRYTRDSAGNVEPGLGIRSTIREVIFLGANIDSQ
jgi:hypothetical protein